MELVETDKQVEATEKKPKPPKMTEEQRQKRLLELYDERKRLEKLLEEEMAQQSNLKVHHLFTVKF